MSSEDADDGEGAPLGRSARKRRDILDAAERAFLAEGFLGASVDEIAATAQVSKPTVYRHFGSKEALFVGLVTDMTTRAGDGVHTPLPEVGDLASLRAALVAYARRQLEVVLTPRLVRMRRLVIGEVSRFPDLARAMYDAGPRRALAQLSAYLREADAQGLLTVPDPDAAAVHLNWLIMGAPTNEAMLLGDDAIWSGPRLRTHADAAVDLLLAAYRA